jgi:hypothetical protein
VSIPRHEYDKHYIPIPDAPQASMIDMDKLPINVQWALRMVREYEAQGAAWPSLLADPVRAWFRAEARASSTTRGDQDA